MLTLRRFRVMIDSFGADLLRWPEDIRTEAEVLLNVSRDARRLMDEAEALDEAIAAASAREDAALWKPGEQDAALARLRSGVEARMAAATGHRPTKRRDGWLLSVGFRWMGMAAGSSFAVIAGLLIGAMDHSAPAVDAVLAMLQPMPIHILAD